MITTENKVEKALDEAVAHILQDTSGEIKNSKIQVSVAKTLKLLNAINI